MGGSKQCKIFFFIFFSLFKLKLSYLAQKMILGKKISFFHTVQNETKKVKDRSERKNRAFITQKMKYEDKNVIRLT